MRHHHFPGFLIAIEGIDGAGKTTQAHHVQEILQKRKLCVIRTKEPTTGHWGQILRDSALTGRLSLEEEVEHFLRDRREHVEKVINPKLEEGHVVIVDRYYFSSMAYQGARGMDPQEIRRRNEAFAPEPDLAVVLDIDPDIGLKRIKMRGDRANHFEQTDALAKAREIFKNLEAPYLFHYDATRPVEKLRDEIVAQFTTIQTARIGKTGATPQRKLNMTLGLFGADPIE